MLLVRDEALLKAYIECLLLLDMTALLSRVIQAIYGITLHTTPLTGSGPRRWRLVFGNGVTLEMASPGLRADPVEREQAAERSSTTIMGAAGRNRPVEATASALQPVGEPNSRDQNPAKRLTAGHPSFP